MASNSTGIPSPRFISSYGQPAEAHLPGMGSQASGRGTPPLLTPSCSYFSIDETSPIYDSMTLHTQTEDSGQELLINPWTDILSNNERANLDLDPGDAFFLPQDSSIMRNDYPFEPDLTAESPWITQSEEYHPPISFLNSDNSENVQVTPLSDGGHQGRGPGCKQRPIGL
jgi:hypothetical protein